MIIYKIPVSFQHFKSSYHCCCYSFSKELKASDNTALMAPYMDHMAQGLVTMATQSTDEVLTYTLESLIMLLKVCIIRGLQYGHLTTVLYTGRAVARREI